MNDKAISLEFTSKEIQSIDKMNAKLKEFAAEIGMSGKAMEIFEKALVSTVSTMAKVKVTSPFSHLAEDTRAAKAALTTLNADLKKTSTLMLEGLTLKNNAGFRKLVTDSKAVLVVQQQINAEIEKQAALKASLLVATGTGNSAKALLAAREYTAELELQNLLLSRRSQNVGPEATKLAITSEAFSSIDKYNVALSKIKSNSKAVTEAVARLSTELKAMNTSMAQGANIPASRLSAIESEIAALEKLAVSHSKIAKSYGSVVVGTGKSSTSLNSLLGVTDKAVASAAKLETINYKLARSYGAVVVGAGKASASISSLLGVQSKKSVMPGVDTSRMQQQVSAMDGLIQRVAKLGTMKVPAGKFKSLSNELHLLNLEFATTGKVSKKALASIITDMTKLEIKARKAKLDTVDWGKAMKFALGGVARSLGAMTYSYSMLLPLIAGMAAGGAVKQIYDLGAAFEYTTTYVEALGDSLEGISAENISSSLLDLEGLRKGPQELADGMKEFAKAGVAASESLGQIAEMAKFATVAEIDLAAATKLVIGQSNAFEISFSDAANMIGAAALSSATTIEELGTALSYTTELATVSGSTFDEVATAMALMANAGIRGSKAATAIRTSVIKMQAPSTTLKNKLDELGISWSAFTEDGQIKNMRTMFTELKRVTDGLKPQDKVGIFKDLFGLRAIKGGATIIKSMGKDWDDLNAKIKGSTEGVSFIEQTYEKLGDTVTAKLEIMGAEFKKALIGSFDSDAVKGMLESLTESLSAESVVNSLKTVVSLLDSVGSALTGTISIVQSLPDDVADIGLILYAMFGKSPIGRTIAGLLAAKKIIGEIREEAGKFSAKGINKKIIDLKYSKLETYPDPLSSGEIEEIDSKIAMFERMKRTALDPGSIFGDSAATDAAVKTAEAGNAFLAKFSTVLPDKLNEAIASSDIDSMLASAIESGNDRLALSLQEKISGVNIIAELKAQLQTAIELDERQIASDIASKITEAESIIEDATDKAHTASMKLELDRLIPPEATPTAKAFNKALNDLRKTGSKIHFTPAEKSLDKIEQKVKAIDAAILKATGEGLNAGQLQALTDQLAANDIAQSFHDIAEATEELNFKTMIDGLKDSDSMVDNLKGSYKELERSINKKLLDEGILDTAEGDDYFRAMITNARIFSKEIEALNKNIEKTKMSFQDMEFGVELDGMTDANRDKAIKRRIQDLTLLAKKAGNAGLEGRKKQIEYLIKARDLILEMNTEQKAVTKAQAQEAYNKYADRYKAVRGGVQKNDPEMLKLAAEANRLNRLYKAGEADPIAAKKANDEKLRLLKEVNKAQLEAQEAQLQGMKEAKEAIITAGGLFSTDVVASAHEFKSIIEGTSLKLTGADSAPATSSSRSGGTDTGKSNKIADINEVAAVQKNAIDEAANLASTAEEVKTAKAKSNIFEISALQKRLEAEQAAEITVSKAFTDQSAVFNTALTNEEAAKFEQWLVETSNSLGRNLAKDLADYDLQGYWKEAVSKGVSEGIDAGAHFPDTFKKPSHPTFSSDSKYSIEGRRGGKWGEGSFAPSKDQLAAGWDTTQMREYFTTAEEGVKILKGGIIEVTQAQSGGEITDSGLVINLKDTTKEAKNTYEEMRKIFDHIPEGRTTMEGFISGLNEAKEIAARAAEETERVKLLEIDPAEAKKATGIAKAEMKELQNAFIESGKEVAKARADVIDQTNSMSGYSEEDKAAALEELGRLKEVLAAAEAAHSKDIADLTTFTQMLKVSNNSTEALSGGAKAANTDLKEINVTLKEMANRITTMPSLPKQKYEGKATGGPVFAGETYVVGERGQELFTPNTNGYITPNDKLPSSRGSNVVDINLSVNGSDPVQVQGSPQSAEDLQRLFENQRRYAS